MRSRWEIFKWGKLSIILDPYSTSGDARAFKVFFCIHWESHMIQPSKKITNAPYI
jgi:hypothetical protein